MVCVRGSAFLLLILLCGLDMPDPGVCEESVAGDGEEYEDYPDSEDDDDDGCHPEEADRCWRYVQLNLLCHMDTPTGRNCTLRNAADFCVSLDDALSCCAQIIDTSCTNAEGRATFDAWLRGLHAVYTRLCLNDANMELISELLESGRCWRLKRFTSCVEDRANLTHVSHLLNTHLDPLACTRLQLTIASCNANSEKNRPRCQGKGQAVFEALASFFSASPCGLYNLTSPFTNTQQKCPSTISPTPQPIVSGGGGGGGGSPALAVVVTVVVMVALVAVVALVLGRFGILTLYVSKLRYRRAAAGSTTSDGDGDGGALYSNF